MQNCGDDETLSLRGVRTMEPLTVCPICAFRIDGEFMCAGGVRAAASSSSWLSIWRWHAVQVDSIIQGAGDPCANFAARPAGIRGRSCGIWMTWAASFPHDTIAKRPL